MPQFLRLSICIIGLSCIAVGCAGNSDTKPLSVSETHSEVLPASFEVAWESTRDALNNLNLQIYTRDKRGFFVSYGPIKRSFFIPRRMQYTILLDEQSDGETGIELEAIPQLYGVSLLTYPGWRDDSKTKLTDDSEAILEEIKSLVNKR